MRAMLTPAVLGGAGAAVAVLAIALVFGRADVGVVAATLLCALAAGFVVPPRDAAPEVAVHDDPLSRDRDGRAVVPLRVDLEASAAQCILLAVTTGGVHRHRLVVAGPASRVLLRPSLVHSGAQEVVHVQAVACGADGMWVSEPQAPRRLAVIVEPRLRTLREVPLPSDPRRLTGAHAARRPGEGGEFRDIHPFAQGDRVQRIDWKATARLARSAGDLFVRRSHTVSDVDVALVVDDGEDVTGRIGDWGRGDRRLALPTSLDMAREAAWSLGSAYLDAGDQVSFQVLSRWGGALPRGCGARHRERLRRAVAGVAAQDRLVRSRTPRVAAGSLVVFCTTLLDDDSLHLVELWRAAGHRVVLVDTLPRRRDDRLNRKEQIAVRIVLGERRDRWAAARAVGADVLVWDADDGEREATMRAMTRGRVRR